MVAEIWSETEFFVILGHFLPFYPYPVPPNDPKKQIFEENKVNAWRYHPFIHICVLQMKLI